MTSRERVLAALAGEPVDRIPIDFGGTRQTGISVWAYDRLRRSLGVSDPRQRPRVFDTFQMLAEIEAEIVERFGGDCVALNRRAVAFGIPNDTYASLTLPDGLEVEVPRGFEPEEDGDGGLVLRRNGEIIAAMPRGGFYFDRFEKYPGALHPDLASWEAPRITAADLAHYKEEARRLRAATDKAVVTAFGPPYELFNGIGQGGFEDWMITFASEPEYVTELYRKLTDAWLENLEAFHGVVGDRIDIVQICDDFGTQSAPFLSPTAFRELLLPAYKRGLDWIHEKTDWKVLLHSDGAIRPLLPFIIEMGVDILNPVQTTATGMEPAALKRDFGGRIAFWGGSGDSQGTLLHGTPEDVAREAREHMAALGPSGHVFASVHNIQADVPAENIIALFDAALTWEGTGKDTGCP